MELQFSGRLWYWKGPAPFHFITVPAQQSRDLHAIANSVSYGWGMVPITARIGGTEWQTTLTPQDGKYLLPVKAAVRNAERVDDGDLVSVRLIANRSLRP